MFITYRSYCILLLSVLSLAFVSHTSAQTNKYLEPHGFVVQNCVSLNCTSKRCCIRPPIKDAQGNVTNQIYQYCAHKDALICCGCLNDFDIETCNACVNMEFCGPMYECTNILGLAIPGACVLAVFVSVGAVMLYDTINEENE
eukprot:TRINITY_DN292_c1_g1_i1.p1 TRINITY_DN292_c1_g1~~TRINITY_DN292_c1_g1_i1.p1  ORF type:complete len:143 (+),score=16.46 TRINITY_DN292_c1_g1_i1:85-513(+)